MDSFNGNGGAFQSYELDVRARENRGLLNGHGYEHRGLCHVSVRANVHEGVHGCACGNARVCVFYPRDYARGNAHVCAYGRACVYACVFLPLLCSPYSWIQITFYRPTLNILELERTFVKANGSPKY